MEHLTAVKKFLKIDKKMLPIKLHYFLYSLAISILMPYIPIILKNIGISATAVGIIYIVCPFITVLVNPLFGWVTDRVQRIKLIVISLIIFETLLIIYPVYIPSLSNSQSFSVELRCNSNNSIIVTSEFLALEPSNRSMICKANCAVECLPLGSDQTSDELKLCGKDIDFETEILSNISFNSLKVITNGTQLSSNCQENSTEGCETMCSIASGSNENYKDQYHSYQFWTLLAVMIGAFIAENGIISLGDAACYVALEGKVHNFGQQRVWLSIGCGIGTMITGYLLDLVNHHNEDKVNFSYCAYVMLTLIIFDVIALSQATLRTSAVPENILKDVCKIFAKPYPLLFTFAAFLIGALSGIQWNYQFWFLEEIGASKSLLGLSVAVLCLAVETPFMLISQWVVKRIGRDNTVTLAFFSFSVWFISLSLICDPRWILIINLTQGPSYGLYYVAMSSYGKMATVPGTDATMQTILGAIFRGLGMGCGNLLGGLGFDLYGGRITFRFFGYFCVGAAVVYKLLTMFVIVEKTSIRKDNIDTKEKVACEP